MKILNQINKKICSIILLGFVLCIRPHLNAQVNSGINWNPELDKIAYNSANQQWVNFKEGAIHDPEQLFSEHASALGLTANDRMEEIKTENDALGFTHIKYQQYYKNLKIEGAECIVHTQMNSVKSLNGKLVKELTLNVENTLNSEQIEIIARELYKESSLIGDDAMISHKFATLKGDEDFNFDMKPELVICRRDWKLDFAKENILLAWKVTVYAMPVYNSATVYFDANTGSVIHVEPLATNCIPSSGATTWYGNQTFETFMFVDFAGPVWKLNSYCVPDASMRSMRGDPIIFYDYENLDNTWFDANGVGGFNQKAGVTTQWGMRMVYDFYKNSYGRLSYDNAYGDMNSFSEVAGGPFIASAANASWISFYNSAHFGRGVSPTNPSDDWNTIDIIGHEYTHGVIQYSAGLNYSHESGALNESFSDIFGEMIENYALGAIDWLVGADKSDGAVRVFFGPNLGGQPDTYLGTNWFNVTGCVVDPFNPGGNDNCGVHTNSGVQNFMFYLLSDGGEGNNDHGEYFNVSGIGLNAAAQIGYRALTVYLTSSSNYTDARQAWISAANDLFGNCSNESFQTAKAWRAVGVGAELVYDNVCGNYSWVSIFNGTSDDHMDISMGCVATFNTGIHSMSAATDITVHPGFIAYEGTELTLYIDPCDITNWKLPSLLYNTNENIISNVESETTSINVFPNPATTMINIEASIAGTDISVTVYDAQLKVVKDFNVIKEENAKCYVTTDINTYPAGIYFVQLKSGEQTLSKKFIIQK